MNRDLFLARTWAMACLVCCLAVLAPQWSVAEELAVAAPVNINLADAQTLAEQLNGVGLKKAEAIVVWREEHGAFTSPEQLVEVKGIGPVIFDKNRELIHLE